MVKRRVRARDTVTTERVGLVVYLLMVNRGKRFTTSDLAVRLDMEHRGTRYMLEKLSRVLPIVEEIDGWVMYPEMPY